MAEPLKNSFKLDVIEKLGQQIHSLDSTFDANGFVTTVSQNFECLELMDRGRKAATALKEYLPSDYVKAIHLLTQTLGPVVDVDASEGMSVFRYLPHSFFIAEYGLNHFDESMQAQYELTQRFTAEFCIRPYLIKYPEQSLQQLKVWAIDNKLHVRRLVSEGTRPRLPWASRLPRFITDPNPIIELLEILKDDPELYVRRSVANNLNDIGKDHPVLLAEISSRWLKDADKNREWLVKHALRSAIKRGEPNALKVLGYNQKPKIDVENLIITPINPSIGDSLKIGFDLKNPLKITQSLMVDLIIHFVKSNGQSSPKVFKLNALELSSFESVALKKTVTLKNLTTRKHYPGVHNIDLQINGFTIPLSKFNLQSK